MYQDNEKSIKTDRVMELFFRAMKGESLSAQQLSYEYNVSARSITRACLKIKKYTKHLFIASFSW